MTRIASGLWGLSFVLGCVVPRPALAHPGAGIVVDARGNVTFVLFGAHHLMRITPDGRVAPFTRDERLSAPHHLAPTPDGGVYVASDLDGRVWRVDRDGRLHLHLDSRDVNAERRFQAGAYGDPFTVDSAGNVYCLSEPRGSLVRIGRDNDVTPLARGVRLGDLHSRAMMVGRDGALYVSAGGGVWRIVGDSARRIRPVAELAEPAGMAIDASGNMLLADFQRARVIRFNAGGAVTTPPWLADVKFRAPTGIAVNGDTIYVLDNDRMSTAVWRVTPAGAHRIYTESFLGWHARPLIAGVPVLLIALALLERRRKAARAKAG